MKNPAALLKEIGNTAQLYFRPVYCTAYPFALNPGTKATKTAAAVPAQKPISGNGTLPACGSQYATNAANLDVTPNSSVQGYSSNNPSPDPAFAPYTSTNYSTANYAKKHRPAAQPAGQGHERVQHAALRARPRRDDR